MQHIEHTEQVKLVMWLRAFYPDLMVAAIPNGGARKAKEAIKLKAEGVLAGMPDLLVAEPSNGFHGLFIEMKTDDGVVSQAQKRVHASLLLKGYAVQVCRSYDEGKIAVENYLNG